MAKNKSIDVVMREICTLFNVTQTQISSNLRVRYIAEARHAFSFAAKANGHSAALIAKKLNRQVNSVNGSARKAAALMTVDADYRTKLTAVI